MPKVTNTTVLNQVNRIAKVLNDRGENLGSEHTATIVVRSVLEHFGLTEELNGDDYKAERLEAVEMVKPFMTAAKNYQNSYLAQTPQKDEKGAEVPKSAIMPAVKGGADKINGEFA